MQGTDSRQNHGDPRKDPRSFCLAGGLDRWKFLRLPGPIKSLNTGYTRDFYLIFTSVVLTLTAFWKTGNVKK